MKPNFSKIRIISFTRKTKVFDYQYRLGNFFILRPDYIKDLGDNIDCKLHFHRHVDFLFSHALKLLTLILKITFSFSKLDSLLMLCFALIRSKLEYAFTAWNSVTITDSNKLETIQRNFAALCHSRFFQFMQYHCSNILEGFNLLTLQIRLRRFDAFFLINVFNGIKCCSFVLETVGLLAPIRNIRNFNMFTCSSSHCPSARCVSTANAVCKSADIFSTSCLSVKSLK
jgi:hypothetical protein